MGRSRGPGLCVWTAVAASCLLCVRLAAEALLCASLVLPGDPLGSGPPGLLTSNPHFLDVLFDLRINVDEKLLSLWLSEGVLGVLSRGLGCCPASPV